MSTDDSPERESESDVYDREGLPSLRATLEDAEGTSNVSESEDISNFSNPTEKPISRPRPPRREVLWLDLGTNNLSLESIKGLFENCLNQFLSSSSNSLLPHITSPVDNKKRRNLHQCLGYVREEITLTSDVSKSAIISHAFPNQSELCSICGQLVQYECTEPSVVDGENQEANSPNGSPHLSRLQLSGNPSPHSSMVGLPSPVSSDMSESESESGSILPVTPPFPPLSNHGDPFMTTLQLRENRPEEIFEHSSLGLPTTTNPDPFKFTRHRRESVDSLADPDFVAWGPPTLEGYDDTHQLPDSSQNLQTFNPDRMVRRRRNLSDINLGSGLGWIHRSSTVSSHRSGPPGPSHRNKPEENLSTGRFHRKDSNAAFPKNVLRTDNLGDYSGSHTKTPDNSPGGRRPSSGFFSNIATMLSKKSST
jgi:hypothetical protein